MNPFTAKQAGFDLIYIAVTCWSKTHNVTCVNIYKLSSIFMLRFWWFWKSKFTVRSSTEFWLSTLGSKGVNYCKVIYFLIKIFVVTVTINLNQLLLKCRLSCFAPSFAGLAAFSVDLEWGCSQGACPFYIWIPLHLKLFLKIYIVSSDKRKREKGIHWKHNLYRDWKVVVT